MGADPYLSLLKTWNFKVLGFQAARSWASLVLGRLGPGPGLVPGPAWSRARFSPGPGPGPGPWSLVHGPWSWSLVLVPGPWSWSLVLVPGPGLCSLVPGPWSLYPGLRIGPRITDYRRIKKYCGLKDYGLF